MKGGAEVRLTGKKMKPEPVKRPVRSAAKGTFSSSFFKDAKNCHLRIQWNVF